MINYVYIRTRQTVKISHPRVFFVREKTSTRDLGEGAGNLFHC